MADPGGQLVVAAGLPPRKRGRPRKYLDDPAAVSPVHAGGDAAAAQLALRDVDVEWFRLAEHDAAPLQTAILTAVAASTALQQDANLDTGRPSLEANFKEHFFGTKPRASAPICVESEMLGIRRQDFTKHVLSWASSCSVLVGCAELNLQMSISPIASILYVFPSIETRRN
jgi:hypothetical protein